MAAARRTPHGNPTTQRQTGRARPRRYRVAMLAALSSALVAGVGGASLVVGTTPGEPARPLRAEVLHDLETFAGWLRRHGVRGYVGEVGWPARDPAEAAAWNELADAWYRAADAERLWVTAWATGGWFDNSYPLAVYVRTPGGLAPRPQARVVERHPSRPGVLRGVAVAGGEFGTDAPGFSNERPGAYGAAYRYEPPETFRALAERGISLVRLPFRWERVQPSLGGDLDRAEVERILRTVADAHAAGLLVILDLHNFGEYRTAEGSARLGAEIDETTFADTWRRLADAFAGAPGILGYDLMNEPVNVQPSGAASAERTWERFSQAAVDAVRGSGDRRVVCVEGYPWSAAGDWPSHHPRPWIADPLRRVRYEAHQYWDEDRSGRYRLPYAEERAAAERRSRSESDARSSRTS